VSAIGAALTPLARAGANSQRSGIWERLRRRFRRRRGTGLSDILIRPDWQSHPFNERVGTTAAWYVLLVPTSGEGHLVSADLKRALLGQRADFTVLVGFFANDPTAIDIRQAADGDCRIVPVQVHAESRDWAAMTAAFEHAISQLEEHRSRKPNDIVLVPYPELIIKRSESAR